MKKSILHFAACSTFQKVCVITTQTPLQTMNKQVYGVKTDRCDSTADGEDGRRALKTWIIQSVGHDSTAEGL